MLQLRPGHSPLLLHSNGAEVTIRPSLARCQRRYTAQVLAVASPPAPLGQKTEGPAILPSPEGKHARNASPGSPFLALGVDPMLVDALPSINVTRPSPIQAAALPAILSGTNCAVQSYTGSGKTLSYLLPVLTLALRRAEAIAAADPAAGRRVPDVPIQALVVAPSQELAMQIMRVAKSLMPPDVRKFAVQQVIGGANPKRQAEALASKPGPLLVVGTPGRLSEMVRSGSLRLHRCPIMVLDEADQLLSPAFAEDINHLSEHCGKKLPPLKRPADSGPAAADDDEGDGAAGGGGFEVVPEQRQTVLVSATLTPSVLSRAARWCTNPRFVSAGAVPALAPPEEAAGDGESGQPSKEKPTWGWGVRGWDGPASDLGPKTRGSAGGVEGDELIPTMPPQLQHFYMVCEPRHKVDTLRRAIHALGVQRALVFMNFQQRLQDTQYKLQARGMKAAALHGELPRLTRTNILNDFRRGRLRALVVSDVAARGIDVPECDAVFHLELPSSAAHYAHRAGRTGRLSAAIAAQAAADAASAAAAAAVAAATTEDAAAAAAAAPRPDRMADDDGLMMDQAAGMVITVVAPNERFVVDKLAQHLGVPLLEAHVAHGELRTGPPPAGYSFDRDTESDPVKPAPAEGARRDRKAPGPSEEEDEAKADRRETGALASTSRRAAKGAAGPAPTAAPVGEDKAAAKTKKDRKDRIDDDEGGKYEVVVDEDDDIVLDDEDLDDEQDEYDYEVLDEDLEAFKRLRPAQVRQLAAAGTVAAAVQLKAQRKKRVVLPGVEPGSAEADKGAKPGPRANAGPSGQAEGRRGRGGRRPVAEDDDEEDERPQARPKSRKELMEQMRRELDEIREEKEKQRRQGAWTGRGRR